MQPNKQHPSNAHPLPSPSIFGNRLFWGQLKCAFHGGARRLRAWHWMGREEVEYEGSLYWTTPGYGYGVTATSIVPGFRPPSRHKARHLDRIHLICNAMGFIQAIKRGIQKCLM